MFSFNFCVVLLLPLPQLDGKGRSTWTILLLQWLPLAPAEAKAFQMLIYLVLMLCTCRVQGEGTCLKQRELCSFPHQPLVHDKNEFCQARKHFECYPRMCGTGSASCFTSHIFSSAEESVSLNFTFAFVVILSWFIHKELNRDHLSCRVLESLKSTMPRAQTNFTSKLLKRPFSPHQL